MDNNFDIDIELQQDDAEEPTSLQLPLNFLSLGEIDTDDVKVYIKQNVYKELEKFAASDTAKELGSILIGDYSTDLGKTHVVISDYIEAKYTDASASTLTFTHETWDYVHKEHQSKFPDKKIIGWQHTHPGYGIFLSNYDMFIQENFFNLPFQIAYVIDPVQNIRGFFQWKSGKVEKLKGFYIYDDVGKTIKFEKPKTKETPEKQPKASKATTVITALLLASTVLISAFAFNLNAKYKQQLKQQEVILAEIANQQKELEQQKTEIENQKADIESQNAIIKEQADTISTYSDLLIKTVLENGDKITAGELLDMIENKKITLSNETEVVAQLKEIIDKAPDDSVVSFRSYTVASGDNLEKICSDNGLDYLSVIGIILTVNGIESPDMIYIGQTLLLPITE